MFYRTALAPFDYVKVKTTRLVGLLLNIFCLRKHVIHLRDIGTEQTRTGLLGLWVNYFRQIIESFPHNALKIESTDLRWTSYNENWLSSKKSHAAKGVPGNFPRASGFVSACTICSQICVQITRNEFLVKSIFQKWST